MVSFTLDVQELETVTISLYTLKRSGSLQILSTKRPLPHSQPSIALPQIFKWHKNTALQFVQKRRIHLQLIISMTFQKQISDSNPCLAISLLQTKTSEKQDALEWLTPCQFQIIGSVRFKITSKGNEKE